MSGLPAHLCGHFGRRTKAGEMCRANVIAGTTACRRHAGKPAAKARAEGAVVLELRRWGLDGDHVDAGETLLRLVSQSARRLDHYGALLHADFVDRDVAALVGVRFGAAGDGSAPSEQGEYIRGLALLEGLERDRLARFCKIALDAGIAERQVRIAEQMGAGIVMVLSRVLTDLGLDPADERVRGLVSTRLRELTTR